MTQALETFETHVELADNDDEPLFDVEAFLSATMHVLPGLKVLFLC